VSAPTKVQQLATESHFGQAELNHLRPKHLSYLASTSIIQPMPDAQRTATHSQTLVVDAETFAFETIEQKNGQATVIRFPMDDVRYYAGDVLLVLSGTDIHFHGMIGRTEDGFGIASDPRGSLLPATVQ
jgi:hypothetical protein